MLPGLWLLGLAAPGSAYTTLTNRSNWQAALSGPIVTDTFSTPINSAQTITLDSGIISMNSGPAVLPNVFNNNSVGVVTSGVNVYDNATQAGGGTASNTVTWLFPSAVTAFGADFIGAGTGRLSLAGDFDGLGLQTLIVNTTIGGSDGFLGIIGTAPFTSIVLGNPSTQVDSFSIDNASFAPVPGVPGPLPLLGSSLAFGWSRRLRRKLSAHGRTAPH